MVGSFCFCDPHDVKHGCISHNATALIVWFLKDLLITRFYFYPLSNHRSYHLHLLADWQTYSASFLLHLILVTYLLKSEADDGDDVSQQRELNCLHNPNILSLIFSSNWFVPVNEMWFSDRCTWWERVYCWTGFFKDKVSAILIYSESIWVNNPGACGK